jgi:hypothetical protein
MNDLEAYVTENQNRVLLKWRHYLEAYDRHFSRYRGRDVVVLEIGVYAGGSLQMWKHYFGPKAKIYGVDFNPLCREVEEENIRIFTGSQTDRLFLRDLKTRIPPVDILIDDGGHKMRQQNVTFEELFDHVKSDGIYVCEDLHTSYWARFGGGFRRRGTFIERSKGLIDQLNGWYSEQPKSLDVTPFTSSVFSMTYYASLLVIEKRAVERPIEMKTGNLNIMSYRDSLKRPFSLRWWTINLIEAILQKMGLKSWWL